MTREKHDPRADVTSLRAKLQRLMRAARRVRAKLPETAAQRGLHAETRVPDDAHDLFDPQPLSLQVVEVTEAAAPTELPGWQLFAHGHYADLVVARAPEGGWVEVLAGPAKALPEEGLYAMPIANEPIALCWTGPDGRAASVLFDPEAGELLAESGFRIEDASEAPVAPPPLDEWLPEPSGWSSEERERLAERARRGDTLEQLAVAGEVLRGAPLHRPEPDWMLQQLLGGGASPSDLVERWVRSLSDEVLGQVASEAIARAERLAEAIGKMSEAFDRGEASGSEQVAALFEERERLAAVARALATVGRAEKLLEALQRVDREAFVHLDDLQRALDATGWVPPAHWTALQAAGLGGWWTPTPS